MRPASMLRRVLAVVVDFFVLYGVWAALGISGAGRNYPDWSGLGIILLFFVLIDLPLTALFGLSAGRAVAGIRVLRVADGRPPGWVRAALRIALVIVTSPVGLLYWTAETEWLHIFGGKTSHHPRFWWDAAAGTALVRPASR